MSQKNFLYPDVVYFKLTRELPGCQVGDVVSFQGSDEECLLVNDIVMPVDYAKKYPNWFQPVSEIEHSEACTKNSTQYLVDRFGLTYEEATRRIHKFESEKD